MSGLERTALTKCPKNEIDSVTARSLSNTSYNLTITHFDRLPLYFFLYSQSSLPPPPPPTTLPPHTVPVHQHHHHHAQHQQHVQSNVNGSGGVSSVGQGGGGGGGFQQMARMMDSLILDNFGPFAFTKITTSHHTHRVPSRATVMKKTGLGSTSNLPQTGHGHSTAANSPSQTMRINVHRNSTGTAPGGKMSYGNQGEL